MAIIAKANSVHLSSPICVPSHARAHSVFPKQSACQISMVPFLDRANVSYQELLNIYLSLGASAPDVLQQTIALCQSVQGIVALSHRSYETAKGVDLALSVESSVLIDLSDCNLDRCVILGLDDSVGCAAFTGDVTRGQLISFQFHIPRPSCVASRGDFGERTGQRFLPCRSPFWRFFRSNGMSLVVVE